MWDYVSEASDAIFGQPPTLSQTKIGADLGGKGRKAVNRIVVSLQRKGLLTLDNARRGASVYYQAARHSVMLDGEVRASAISARRKGTVSGTVSPAGPDREILSPDHQGDLYLSGPAGRRIIQNSSQAATPAEPERPAEPDVPPCHLCGPGSMVESKLLTRVGLTEVYHCAGQNSTCSYVYDAVSQTDIVVPGTDQWSIPDLAACIRRVRAWQVYRAGGASNVQGTGRVWVSTEDDPGVPPEFEVGNSRQENDPLAKYYDDYEEWQRG